MKAVIFDLNGLFIQSPNLSDRFQEKFGVSVEKFLAALKDIMPKLRNPGAGDAFTYWVPYLKEWNVNLSREDFFNFWFNAEKEVLDLVKVARKLKNKGVKIFILSNNFEERADYYKKNFSFLKMFDKVYYSWQTGLIKPDKKAFKNILSENNLKPEECLYFDNSKENVEAAKILGINAHFFGNTNTVKRVLEK